MLFSRIKTFAGKQTLKFRVRLWVGTIILMLGLSIMTSFYLLGKNDRVNEIKQQLQQVITLQSLYIERWTGERAADIKRIANSDNARQLNMERLFRDLKSYFSVDSEYNNIFFVSATGYSSTESPISNNVFVGDRDYFIAASNKQDFISGVLISKATGHPMITFSSPILSPSNEFIGAIVGTVKLQTLDAVMTNLNFGKTGELFVIDEKGAVITKSKETNSQIGNGEMKTEIVQRALQDKKDFSPYQGYRDRAVYGGYQWANEHKWIIVGEITTSEVFENLNRILLLLIVITLVVLLVSLYAVFILTSWVERPIHHLLKGTKIVKDGNYDYQIASEEMKHAPIELRELCETYNVMSSKLKSTVELLEYSALKDHLTGIHNRRYIMTEGSALIESAIQLGQPCSVIMVDVDFFKKINDTYGHIIGDRVLKHIARQLSQHTDRSIVAGRYGGEEFIILAINMDASGSLLLAEELRIWMIEHPYTDGSQTVGVTVSMGVADYLQHLEYGTTHLEDMISRADQALYWAKSRGRNRIDVHLKVSPDLL
ncbi:sensor domain-containing diguanylate cyclase [Paenibacillus eucommiae]|uniref:Diguanylate cyclase (GGDEF)-like protein n=1 Tax=Paenibacillus eucommiae TaxID=1355755 RepID=A0ABS4ITJ1_9BACL|nr:diguanylate cyclase [Paenibacillus eucommiae]MBP1990889.1 diguanylate cyclase (GGDEF)-like protein [Paenibacillus eucommiae]